jgi:hypothetical protein
MKNAKILKGKKKYKKHVLNSNKNSMVLHLISNLMLELSDFDN